LIPASFTKVANFIFQRVQELPFATKCSFTWLKLMHQYSQLPEFLIIDFSNCLQVKPEEVKHSYFEMLLLMPDVPGIDPEVCKPGDCCFLIDPQNTILRSIVRLFNLV
jgi:hypothetical protein